MQTLTFENDHVAEVMRRLRYFKAVPRAEIKRLAVGACQVSVQRGDVVARQGMPLEFVCIVVSGQLKLSISSRDGVAKVLAIYRREDSFGEAQALLDQPSPATLQAVRDSHLLIVEKSLLLQEMRRNAALSLNAMANVSQGLLNMIRDAEMCHLRSSVDRVLCYLRHHSEKNADQDEWVHEFPALKQDIAASLSITPETFSRVLRGLERDGVIHVRGARVRIIDTSRFGELSAA